MTGLVRPRLLIRFVENGDDRHQQTHASPEQLLDKPGIGVRRIPARISTTVVARELVRRFDTPPSAEILAHSRLA